jgi:hypothetical protein
MAFVSGPVKPLLQKGGWNSGAAREKHKRTDSANNYLLMVQGHSSTCRDSHFVWKEPRLEMGSGVGRRMAWPEFTCLNDYLPMSNYLIIAFCSAELY